jgi:hypothetical protein
MGALDIVYPNAHRVDASKGDKKRLGRLQGEIDALVAAGTVDAANVAFISARFWVISRDGQPYFVHMDGDSLEWLAIEREGLRAKDGLIHIGRDKTLAVSDGDLLILRPLVNKYRKISGQ